MKNPVTNYSKANKHEEDLPLAICKDEMKANKNTDKK